MKSLGIREKKAAMLRVAILEEMLRLLKTRSLNEITVEELCTNVHTTKVTFFKYFSYKEQVLDYFICRWLYEHSFMIHCKQHSGKEGIYAVFQSICEHTVPGKKIMLSLVQYYSKLTEKPPALEPAPYEYYLFNREAFEQKTVPLQLGQVFIYYLSQIETISPDEYPLLVAQLVALMYGVPIQTHMMGLEEMYGFYEAGLRSILGEEH